MKPKRVLVVDDEIMYKFFEGYWDVRQTNGKWLLWKPRIREIKDSEPEWFLDQETRKEVEEFEKTHDDYETYRPIMYELSKDPENASLNLQELYDKAKQLRIIR